MRPAARKSRGAVRRADPAIPRNPRELPGGPRCRRRGWAAALPQRAPARTVRVHEGGNGAARHARLLARPRTAIADYRNPPRARRPTAESGGNLGNEGGRLGSRSALLRPVLLPER